MILGIGSDLIDVRRIERTIERHGDRFLDRIFTATERAKAERPRATGRRPMPSASRPRRPAPRRSAPACAPACSGAIWAWSICRRAGPRCGSPAGRSRGSRRITPAGLRGAIDLTITDEDPMAQAFVIISAVPAAGIA